MGGGSVWGKINRYQAMSSDREKVGSPERLLPDRLSGAVNRTVKRIGCDRIEMCGRVCGRAFPGYYGLMSDPNFYQILGVGRSASAKEIKAAYRDLVKRHHPDLFPAPGAKAQATEKLRQINAAYAVLGNAKRRHDYDQRLIQRPRTRPRARAAPPRRETPPPRPRGNLRSTTDKIKILKQRLHVSKKQAGYALAAVMVVLALIYAGQSVPRLITAWTLLEKLEVSEPASKFPSEEGRQDWVPVGQYTSVSECAGILKERVRKDEREGGQAVFGNRNGTVAITMLIKPDTTAQARENSNSIAKQGRSTANESALQSEPQTMEETPGSVESGMSKRVRSLECRATQWLETESRLRSTLRRMGLPL